MCLTINVNRCNVKNTRLFQIYSSIHLSLLSTLGEIKVLTKNRIIRFFQLYHLPREKFLFTNNSHMFLSLAETSKTPRITTG